MPTSNLDADIVQMQERFLDELSAVATDNNRVDPENYNKFEVKRGLRNANGSGVLAGLTVVGDVHGFIFDEGDRVPRPGRLRYRGIDVDAMTAGFREDDRFGYEETAYLLLFALLPTKEQLERFVKMLGAYRKLPENFTEDMILSAPSPDIMNKLARCTLASYSYDKNPDDNSIRNVLRQSMELIARFPTMIAYAYQAKRHYYDGKSLFIHMPKEELSTAENILRLIRPTGEYSMSEAKLLDLLLVLHAEHGGGNNSSFTTRVISSADTDTYSAIAGAVGSLKGSKHGGANNRVMGMMADLKTHVKDWTDEGLLRDYLLKILNKDAYDRSGLIYGLGHAIYTLSDPRAIILKAQAEELAGEKDRMDEFNLYKAVERLAIETFCEFKKTSKSISVNVDFYSGFVYDMLGIPPELYTPLFATSRISGWCAHRIEEIVSGGRIYRPAYKCVLPPIKYIPLDKRVEGQPPVAE